MAEYIEREAILTAVKKWYEMACYPLNQSHYNEGEKAAYETAIDEIISARAADVAPVRHGHWTGTEYDGYADGNPVYTLFECSECGVEYEQEEHYCPWCGAKMDGEDNE